jgi:hypothetical protein
MTRCVTCVFRNISNPPQHNQSLTYETRFGHFYLLVPLRPVYLLPADSCKEYLATETASPRVPRSSWSPQRAPAESTLSGSQWHWPYQWLPRHPQWPDGHSRRPWQSRGHANSQRCHDDQRCQSSCYPVADPAAELEPSAHGHTGPANWSPRFRAPIRHAVASNSQAQS